MRALTAPEMLNVWERGLAQLPLQRSLMLLAAAEEGPTIDAVAALSTGQRDACLLTLREWAFGQHLSAVANCPRCNDRLEINFLTSDVRVPAAALIADSRPLHIGEFRLFYRAPNSLDFRGISGRDPAIARWQLLKRCVSDITREGSSVDLEQLPAEVIEKVVELIAQSDPQADVRIAMSCSQCRHQWQADFDIGVFFWKEIHVWAERILHDVHVLAKAYGWSQMDILNLSSWRRQFYLDCINQ